MYVDMNTIKDFPNVHYVNFRYNVTIGSSPSIMGPDIPQATKDTFYQHLKSYNFWSLTGIYLQTIAYLCVYVFGWK